MLRRAERAGTPAMARQLFAEAPCVHLASTLPDGSPVLRTLNGVVLDDPDRPDSWSVAWHGAPEGEKLGVEGRPAVIACEEVVATIPSWFTTRERACPATTWYRSAQITGVVRPIDDPARRAAVLQRLMERFQPEGRHRPLRHDDPMYTKAIAALSLMEVTPDTVHAKASLGHDKPEETRQAVLRGLWDRGASGDLRALTLSLAVPPERWPAWLAGPVDAVRLHPHVDGAEVIDLVGAQTWVEGHSRAALIEAWDASAARIGAHVDGRLIGCARAVADGTRFAYVMDVAVEPAWQGRGVGRRMIELLLDHPAVRGCRQVLLRTKTAEGFYVRLGFDTMMVVDGRPWMRRFNPAR